MNGAPERLPQGDVARPTYGSPIAPGALWTMVRKPGLFFQDAPRLAGSWELAIVGLLTGIGYLISRVDKQARMVMRDTASSGWEALVPWLEQSWLHFWSFVGYGGILEAVLLYFIGGWWYRVRLRWCGAVEPASDTVGAVFLYQHLIYYGPLVLFALAQTVWFPDPGTATEAWGMPSVAMAFLYGTSCWVSYQAVRTAFDVDARKAVWWFQWLPIAFFVVVTLF